jgi:biotin-(acetyl-CoA carboxylase) ligase
VKAEGVVQGVDERGRLLVEADDAVVAVAAGEVTLRA